MTTYKARTRTEGDYGNSPQAAALRLQLGRVRAMEDESPEYLEMCASADARVRAEQALPRQQNGKLLARALASSAVEGPSAAGAPAELGGTQGDRSRHQGSDRVVQVPPTSEARA